MEMDFKARSEAAGQCAAPSADCSNKQSCASHLRPRRQTVGAFVIFHLLACLATIPWLFSWEGLVLVFLGNYVFCSIGIGLCFHRALCHGSLKLPKWLEYSLAVLGVCSLQDSPCYWVAVHRKHHKHSDEEPDPHSPLAGFLWSHFGWVLTKWSHEGRERLCTRYAPDLLRDPFYRFLEKHWMWAWVFALHAVLIALAGFSLGWVRSGDWLAGVQFGASLFVWGVVVRLVYTWHITWAVNSVAHLWGYRNYRTNDNSRNNWLVALATNGEGWHNNHHADQRSASHGHCWWELDVTYWTIRLLEFVGLAKEVIPPRKSMTESPEELK